MRAYNHLFVSWRVFEEFLNNIKLDSHKKQLIRIHSTIHSMSEAKELALNLKEYLPNAVIIGCSASGIICEGRIIKETCLISIAEMEECELQLGLFSCKLPNGEDKTGEELGKEVSEHFVKGQNGLMLLFMPLSYHKTARFVGEMNRQEPQLKMCGGTACFSDKDYASFSNEAYIMADTEVVVTDMAAVLITGPELYVQENVVCGVEKLGKNYEVTGVDGTYLAEVEGMDAAEWYEGLLGTDELLADPLLAGLFPLVRDIAGQQIAHNLVYEPYMGLPEPWQSAKKSRISVFSEIIPGTKFSLGYFDPQKIVKQLDAVYNDMKTQPIEVVFAYDCLSRMWMLHDCATWEVSQFYTTNMSGALLAGEISNIENKNVYANSTFVLAGISEHPESRLVLRAGSLVNVAALQHNNVNMINYLLKTGHKQLSEELNAQQEQMRQAMFFCEELGVSNQTQYLYECERLGLNKIAVFSVKNDKVLRVFMGQQAFVEEWKRIYAEVTNRFRGLGLRYYIYGDYSLLLAVDDRMNDTRFLSCVRGIYEYLSRVVYKESSFTYTCAVVMHEDSALEKAEEALQYAHKHKMSFVQYDDVPDEVFSVKEEMHMLQVLREALSEGRIIPYFQGIRDNRNGRINIYEALMRIHDSQGQIYFPGQFLPVAKDYNLYETLSLMMVRTVMDMFKDKDDTVSINLNVQDIYDPEMLKTIFEGLEQAKHPENFVFELVETEEIRDYQFIKTFADSIHAYGAKVAIDDFGSGFSSLLHIIRLDPDILKLDGAIIKEISNDEKCREFVELINGWCVRREKEVVAEYVENEEIQKVMEEIGITYSQGYYYCKPAEWEDC